MFDAAQNGDVGFLIWLSLIKSVTRCFPSSPFRNSWNAWNDWMVAWMHEIRHAEYNAGIQSYYLRILIRTGHNCVRVLTTVSTIKFIIFIIKWCTMTVHHDHDRSHSFDLYKLHCQLNYLMHICFQKLNEIWFPALPAFFFAHFVKERTLSLEVEEYLDLGSGQTVSYFG